MVLRKVFGESPKSKKTMLAENNGFLPALLSDLDLAVLEKVGRERFSILGDIPDWFGRCFSVPADKTIDSGRLALPGEFVSKAENLWKAKSAGWVHSDPCRYEDCFGDHVYLKAAALHIGPRPLLLLRLLFRRRAEVWKSPRRDEIPAATEPRPPKTVQDLNCFHGLVGRSLPMRQVFTRIQEVGPTGSTVLLVGATGTGKELAARAIHLSSPRKDKPFIAVNCAALSESLLTSQLFGHKRGSFTGAVSDQKGLIEAAHGGTLLLDEIGDIPMSVQASLLRALQEKEVTRLGECHPRSLDVRLIASTQHDLKKAVEEGRFRSDLYYRICVTRIALPLLRDRRDDIPLLVWWFLEQSQKHTNRRLDVSENALRILVTHSWPGNVRELKAAIECAMTRCSGPTIRARDLPSEVHENGTQVPADLSEQDEAERIRTALKMADGNRSEAARLLRISRSTLYRHLARIDNPIS